MDKVVIISLVLTLAGFGFGYFAGAAGAKSNIKQLTDEVGVLQSDISMLQKELNEKDAATN